MERPAPGQPTMNERMHRRAEESRRWQEKQQALENRVKSLSADGARELVATLKRSPDDIDTYLTVLRYYEGIGNVTDRYALFLWYIEYHPAGKVHPGNIDPGVDAAAYARGKALWLSHLQRPRVPVEVYCRAARFLEAKDKALAGSTLQAGQKAYPGDTRWASEFGMHYALVLLGSAGPIAEGNVVRTVSAGEAASPYAQSVRSRLAESSDPAVLAQTAQWLAAWTDLSGTRRNAGVDSLGLARTYVDRALSIDREHRGASAMRMRLAEFERVSKLRTLESMPEASLSDSDRMLRTLHRMRMSWTQTPGESEARARQLLELAARNATDELYGDAVFEAHMILGKVSAQRGDRKTAARELLAAAATPGSARIRQGQFEMNLPRALVDLGERSAVAEFLERMAPKTTRAKQFEEWAAEIRKGVNPELLPTFSHPACSKDPC